MEEESRYLRPWNLTSASTEKRLGYVKCVLHKDKGYALHWIKMNLQRKTITVNGQTVAMIDSNGLLNNKYEDIEVEVQNLMEKWLTKNS